MASTCITSQQLADIARHDPDQLVRVSYTNVYNGRKYTFRDTAANVVRELPRNAAISKSKIRRNPVTRAPDSIWSEAQRKAGKRVLQDGRVITEVDVWEHGTVRLTVATEESQGSTWWYWILSDGKKVAGFGSAIQRDGKLFVENSWIARNLRGMGLYQSSIKALRQASGLPVASARTRSKAADRSWRRMGAQFDEAGDRWEINPLPRPMTYAAAHAWERQAAERRVSRVARSARGFMRAYQAAGSFANLSAWWKRRRAGFIARHMAQAGRLWEHVGGRWRPTRRGLALIMWAFMPPGRPR